MMQKLLLGLSIIALSACEQVTEDQASSKPADIKLYAMECGHVSFTDLKDFSSNGEYNGRKAELPVPCYLIRHPKGDLVWDAGVPDALNAEKDGLTMGVFTATMPVTMASQFEQLGLKPSDVKYFALSHSHFDHVGNAYQFADVPLLIRKEEHEWMYGAGQEVGAVDPRLVDPLRDAETIFITGEYDVFGDGSVTIIPTPGHPPGHNGLLVKLAKTGPVMLSGDLFHLRESREKQIIPAINSDQQQTFASMTEFEERAKAEGARVIIQHDPEDWAETPKFPKYLD